jgi:hypothetical protein
MPWTWARVLRDQGPRSRDFLCAMLTLRTWMDENGFAYPSLRTWAKGARMAMATLRKHLRTAEADGWLGVDQQTGARQNWKLNTYRCAVPDTVELTEKDETLAAALVSQFGDIDERCVTHADTALRQSNGQGVSPIADTASSSPIEGVSNGQGKVCQNTPEGVSNQPASCVRGVSAESRKSLADNETAREVLEVPILEVSEVTIKGTEGAALARNTTPKRVGLKKTKPEPEPETPEHRANRIRIALKAWPEYSDEAIAKAARVSPAEVDQIRSQA